MYQNIQEEMLFGKIAVKKGFITEEQLEECIKLQKSSTPPQLIGIILKDKGYITREQLREIIEYQKKHMRRPATDPEEQKSDIAFGFIAVKLKFTTLDRVYECVREQTKAAKLGLYFRLGEVFVKKGYLTSDQVKDILAQQNRTIMECIGCGTRFNVIGYTPDRTVKCTKCGRRLETPADPNTIAVDRAIDLKTPAEEEPEPEPRAPSDESRE
jgi:hypothetical protein